MPLVIAHRGASAYQVENSLAAFRTAQEQGTDGIELDVHLTADGVAMVHHDTEAGGLAITEVERADLANVTLPNGETLPTLADALAAIGDSTMVFIEVKSLPADQDDVLLTALDDGPVPAMYHLHSFDHRIVKRLKETRALTYGVLSASYPIDPVTQLTQTGATELWQHESLVDVELVEAVHGMGGRVYAWTVNDPGRMEALLNIGVDAICTDKPDVARKVVG